MAKANQVIPPAPIADPNTANINNNALVANVSPAIITSSAATKDLNTIKKNVTEVNTGIQTQAQKIAAEKTAADALATTKAAETAKTDAARIAEENKKKELEIKNKALAGGAVTLPTDPTFQGQLNRHPDEVKSVETTPDGSRIAYFKDGSSQMISKDPNAPKTIVSADAERDELSKKMLADAQTTFDKITGIQNGTIPLDPGEIAQIEGLKKQFEELIEEQKQTNLGAQGTAQIRGYQTGAAEYDPSFQAKTVGSIITAGANKIATLNTKMASAVATLTQAFKDDKIEGIKSAYTVLNDARKERQATIDKTISDTQKAVEEARKKKKEEEDAVYKEVTKPIQDLAEKAKMMGAAPETIQKILASEDLATAYYNAGEYSSGGTGVIGEYNFYKAQATAAGQVPMTFDAYQNEDANRKRSIAAAGVSGTAGLNPKQVAIFNSLTDKMNKSPLVAANDRVVVLRDVADKLKTDPTNAALQVAFIYSMIQALDTYQSAVREGEIGLLSSTQGLGDKLQNFLPKLEKGNPLSENKINEYLGVSNLLVDSIGKAAEKKRKGFQEQAKISGVGDAFLEYEQAVNGSTAGGLVKNGADAKLAVDNFVNENPEKASIALNLSESGKSDIEIYEYLQANGLVE